MDMEADNWFHTWISRGPINKLNNRLFYSLIFIHWYVKWNYADCDLILSCENRFNIVTICLNKELSNFTSWSIQAFVFEVEDRERISGSAYGGQQDICCTNDLPKLTVCNDGQGCHRPSPMNSNWPEVYGVAFYHAQEINSLFLVLMLYNIIVCRVVLAF